jgi:NAD(P)-dependent dehydrogenase (short-subunit alcohol dehydrogenase family)
MSRVGVVTGAGSGLGAALAKAIVGSGMAVAVADIHLAGASAVAADLAQSGADARAYRVDVGSRESVEALAAEVERDFGACHLVCANVGVQQLGTIDSLAPEEWDWVFDVNLHGSVATARAFLPLVRRSEGQRNLLFTASTSALYPVRRLASYTASKYAVLGMAETLRLELAAEGIGVSVLLPGPMATTHLQSSAAAKPASLEGPIFHPDDVAIVSQDTAVTAESVISPELAVRNVLRDLAADEPYIVTHDVHADRVAARFEAILKAFERART